MKLRSRGSSPVPTFVGPEENSKKDGEAERRKEAS
jgi:hypothetical protein